MSTAPADSVSIFAEGTFSEQILELVTYISQKLPEQDREAFLQPFQDALQTVEGQKPPEKDVERRRQIFSQVLSAVDGLGTGSDKEIEGFFNLIISHLVSLRPIDSAEASQDVSSLLEKITSSPSENNTIKYRVLSLLFNAISRSSPLRPNVHLALIKLAIQNDDLSLVRPTLEEVEVWLSEWNIPPEEKSSYLRTLVDALKPTQPETSYQFLLYYLRILPPSSSVCSSSALEAIATALKLPSIFDFDPLFKLEAIVSVQEDSLFSLLQIFMNKGLDDFVAWESSHPGVLEQNGLDRSALEHKIKLLTIASLGHGNIGKDISYSTIASATHTEPSSVENWIIDCIRSGLITARISQKKQSVRFIRATARAFEREQWETLEQRLMTWKTGLTDVLEIVASARRQGASYLTAPQAVAT